MRLGKARLFDANSSKHHSPFAGARPPPRFAVLVHVLERTELWPALRFRRRLRESQECRALIIFPDVPLSLAANCP